MDKVRIARLAAITGLVMLVGCRSTPNNNNPREILALAGVARLREAFNRGACGRILDEADEVFRVSQPESEWLEVCERMQKNLGWWRNFQAEVNHTGGVPLRVVVYGEAEFEKGRYHLETVWHFDRGRAELFMLSLTGNGEQIVMPRSPILRTPHRLMDPPPRVSGPPSSSG